MDVVELDRQAMEAVAALLAGIRSDQHDAPTPCAEWRVRDLVVHLIAGNVKYLRIAEGDDWARGLPEVEVGDDPVRTYRETSDSLLEAWRQPGVLEREVTLPRGRGPAEDALHLHLAESLVHGWDLAKATGQPFEPEGEVVEVSLAFYQSWLPPQRPPGVPFSGASVVLADAPPIDRFAAYLGRDVGAWT